MAAGQKSRQRAFHDKILANNYFPDFPPQPSIRFPKQGNSLFSLHTVIEKQESPLRKTRNEPWRDLRVRFRLATWASRLHFHSMQSYELLREVFEKTSPKEVSGQLGLSLSMIYKWAEPPEAGAGSGANNPLDRMDALLRCTGDLRLVQWLCQCAGGFFI